MKRQIVSIALVALIFRAMSPAFGQTLPREGRAAPAFSLPDTQKRPRKLASFLGRPTLLAFFCGCRACQELAVEWGRMQRAGVLTTAVESTLPSRVRTKSTANNRRSPKSKIERSPKSKIENRKSKIMNPLTVVVYMGDSDAARAFVEATGLDPARTVVLSDADYKVTRSYSALPCPRLYVLDAAGLVRYINNHADDAPQMASATMILSHVVDALRAMRR